MIKVGDLVRTGWYFLLDTPKTISVDMMDATSPKDAYVVIEVEDMMCRIVLPGRELKGWIERNKLRTF